VELHLRVRIEHRLHVRDDGRWRLARTAVDLERSERVRVVGVLPELFPAESDGTGAAISYGSNGWTFQGRAPSWKGTTLTFTGIQQTARGDYRARETFTWIAGKLQHRWEEFFRGAWRTTSDTTCVHS